MLKATALLLVCVIGHALAADTFSLTAYSNAGCTDTNPEALSGTSGECTPFTYNGVSSSARITCGSTITAALSAGSTSCSTTGSSYRSITVSPNTCSDPVTVSLNGQSITIYVKVSCTTPGSGCFSAHDTVVLDSGATVQYSSLQIGDRVLSASSSGDLFYDKVFRITHHDHAEEMDFLAVTTSDGKTLELTATHMLHIGTCCSVGNLKLASTARVGDTLFVTVGKAGVREVTITAIATVRRTGVYNVHTLGGNIVVNGVVASHYTTESTWSASSRSLSPIWYNLVDLASSVLGAEDASVPKSKNLRA